MKLGNNVHACRDSESSVYCWGWGDILDIEHQHYNQRLKQEIETTSDLFRLKGAVYEYLLCTINLAIVLYG